MKNFETEVVIIGAGSAGLCAGIQAANAGAKVMIFDENHLPGGQLFKQIHKFFGSREHRAGIRGYEIGKQLLDEVEKSGADVHLNSVVYGIFDGNTLGVVEGDNHYSVKAKKIIIASGGKENYLPFKGSTLPGVMGAGAAQTMVNVNRVLPGKEVIMVGSGNVGLIVSYQLMQAGANVKAIVEAAPSIGGYGVHASKICRAGVPIKVRHTVLEAYGENEVEGAVVAELDENWNVVPGSEQNIACDTICLAVGLNPMSELAYIAGCEMTYIPLLGGHVPMHDENLETTVPGIYVAGDVTGVEEASTAMEEGNLAGISVARALGLINDEEGKEIADNFRNRMLNLRSGAFGEGRRIAKATQVEAFNEFQAKEGAK
ncbi:MAG: NAD(P)/FAD-dependent oxidoreductase [Tissierellia bacterium]|nr:NAD(P)/FAD-dependent oxidoreductase [Tissierellia bacterium]